jgi:hypothetical protein
MTLTNQLHNLNPKQLKHLSATMLDTSIAFETDGDWREIIRRAKQRKVGLLLRIYELLLTATREEIDAMARSLAEIE